MPERSYTVNEIDDLRRAVDNRYLWGRFRGPRFSNDGFGASSVCYREETKAKVVEEQVRTYMLAGVTAEDLFASEAD